MPRRRAGRRLAISAQRRRRELPREHRQGFLGFALGFAAIAAVSVALMAWFSNREWAFFVAGAMFGIFITGALLFVNYVDPVGARIQSGVDGEIGTEAELAELRRHGWRAVHNLHLTSGDIDHIAVGPGGVIVIETKSSNADWQFLERQAVIGRWARQAHQSAFRARHLIRQLAKVDTTPTPYLVTWIPGQPDGPDQLDHGVIRIRGLRLRGHLRELPAVLDDETVRRIASQLDAFGTQLDAAAGIGPNHWQRTRQR